MTTALPRRGAPVAPAPPFSRALRRVAGASLVAAGLLNGLSQALGGLVTHDLDSFSDQITWAGENGAVHRAEQTALLVSSLVMLLGLLGVAHVCRHRAPRLTAVATPLVVLGMWGFGNVLAMGYVTGTVAPPVLGTGTAVLLNDALPGDPGVLAAALLPHLVGSFLGLLLLCVAAWRAGFPRVPVALLVAFLLWDFLLPPLGPVDPHWLLAVSWVWLGVHLLRLPDAVWRAGDDGGAAGAGAAAPGQPA